MRAETPSTAGQPADDRVKHAGEAPVRRVVRCLPPDDPRYRYLLDVASEVAPSWRLTVVMKNPSRASETRSDPTIGKVEAWARRRGCDAVAVVNLFALRATRPAALNGFSYDEIVGPENDRIIMAASVEADLVIAAWGEANGIDAGRYERRIREVLALLAGVHLYTVGPLTRLGYPRHGLLWNGGCELGLWTGSAAIKR